MRVANAMIEEEVEQDEAVAVVVIDDGKLACDVCWKRYKTSSLKTHKAYFLIFRNKKFSP